MKPDRKITRQSENPQEFAIACENCNRQIGWIFAIPSVWMALKTISCNKCRPCQIPIGVKY